MSNGYNPNPHLLVDATKVESTICRANVLVSMYTDPPSALAVQSENAQPSIKTLSELALMYIAPPRKPELLRNVTLRSERSISPRRKRAPPVREYRDSEAM
jgi:hypothetical protein